MHRILIVAGILHITLSAPQFVTFKDGKVGVNFGGYSAAAGLGGLLTGNTADGGLSAGAKTPWGPRAAAGIGGALNGGASGVAYAGAQANADTGAGAVIGGATSGERRSSYSDKASTDIGLVAASTSGMDTTDQSVALPTSSLAPQRNARPRHWVQKIKPPKKYVLVGHQDASTDVAIVHSKKFVKVIHKPSSMLPFAAQGDYPAAMQTADGGQHANAAVHVRSGLLGSILNIPIGILQSLQESLGGIEISKSTSYVKNV